jgi:hypothetical protein
MPSQEHIDQVRSSEWLPVVDINASKALEAASYGCAFSQWTIAELEENDETVKLDDDWSLCGGFHSELVLKHGADLPFIVFSCLYRGVIVYDLDWAALLAEQGWFPVF